MNIRNYSGTNFITALRAIAVLLVFLTHSNVRDFQFSGYFVNNLVSFGPFGVEIFFVISGFTIFYQIFEKNYDLKNFILVRALRISLVYFPVIIFLYFLYKIYGIVLDGWAYEFNDGHLSLDNLLIHLLYLGYLSVQYANTIIGVEWTLNIEIFYYFLFSCLIYKQIINNDVKKLLILIFLFFIIGVVFLVIGKFNIINSLLVHWTPFLYGYMFLLGGMAYVIRKRLNETSSLKKLNQISNINFFSMIIFLIILIMTHSNLPHFVDALLISVITFCLLIFTLDTALMSKIFNNKVLLFIGSISYSFYLVHFIVINSKISGFFTKNSVLILGLDLTMAILISFLLFYVFELKIYNKLKKIVLKNKKLGIQ